MPQMKIVPRLLLISLAFTTGVMAQGLPANKLVCGNGLFEPSKPPVVITFDRTEIAQSQNRRKANIFWLKLRNNTKCEIEVTGAEGSYLSSTRFARDENGQFIRNA